MPEAALPVLIADDQSDVRDALRLFLKSQGYATHAVNAPAAALHAVATRRFAVALIDLNYTRDTTSGTEGLALLSDLKRSDPELPVVAMTAWGSIELAVEAMRRGAGDFIEKPWDNARLASVLRNQVALGAATRQAGRLGAENRLLKTPADPSVIAVSESMRAVVTLIDRVAPTDAAVLLLGDNGTGKGILARRLHALSQRREKSLVQVNMGGLAESVFESEMFGHVRGAFTDAKTDRIGRVELADGGTLFLDEVANLSLPQQAKLLRVLEEGEFEPVGSSRTLRSDLRVVSATNVDLHGQVQAGNFRSDLFYRLNTVEVCVPALHARPEDIVPLAQHFLALSTARYGRGTRHFTAAAQLALESYGWPGNVRELMHVIERATLLCATDVIEPPDLGLAPASPPLRLAPAGRSLAETEGVLINDALARCQGNIHRAAEQLGLSRAALYRRLQKLGLKGGR
jgi:DNA-binding NtrC family response regulator